MVSEPVVVYEIYARNNFKLIKMDKQNTREMCGVSMVKRHIMLVHTCADEGFIMHHTVSSVPISANLLPMGYKTSMYYSLCY